MTLELSNLQYCNQTVELKKTIESSFLSLGERLLHIRDGALFQGQWSTFEMFLEDAKISPGTASKLINIYQRFFLEWQFKSDELVQAGGWSVVAALLPVCKTREQAEDWLHKSHVLSRGDLEKEIKELKTGIQMSDCQHDDHYLIRVCRRCGDRVKDYEEDTH